MSQFTTTDKKVSLLLVLYIVLGGAGGVRLRAIADYGFRRPNPAAMHDRGASGLGLV